MASEWSAMFQPLSGILRLLPITLMTGLVREGLKLPALRSQISPFQAGSGKDQEDGVEAHSSSASLRSIWGALSKGAYPNSC